MFFLGGSEDVRKISWIQWDIVCCNKEKGGLGVGQLCEFNMALLGKWWWWRLKEECGSFWLRVLSTRLGQADCIKHVAGEGGFMWLSKANISLSVGTVEGSWINDNSVCDLGDDNYLLFWWNS